jgi:hypothetical protein
MVSLDCSAAILHPAVNTCTWNVHVAVLHDLHVSALPPCLHRHSCLLLRTRWTHLSTGQTSRSSTRRWVMAQTLQHIGNVEVAGCNTCGAGAWLTVVLLLQLSWCSGVEQKYRKQQHITVLIWPFFALLLHTGRSHMANHSTYSGLHPSKPGLAGASRYMQVGCKTHALWLQLPATLHVLPETHTVQHEQQLLAVVMMHSCMLHAE